MKVLIVGGGGREHAIAMCVSKSAKCDKLYCAPGNAGIAKVAECAPIGAMEFDKLVAFAKEKEIDFVIVGMDDPYKLYDFPYAKTYVNLFGKAPCLQRSLVKLVLGKIESVGKNPISFEGYFERED